MTRTQVLAKRSLLSRVAGSLGLILVASLIAGGCTGESRPDARSIVMDFLVAVNDSDTTFIITHVDLTAAAQGVREDLVDPEIDTTATEPPWDARLLGALTGDGILRERWMGHQRVVGGETVTADTALVDVSFIDRVTHVQYLNQLRLEYRGDTWMIVDFRAMSN